MARDIATAIACEFTHVVWIPDSLTGTWEADLVAVGRSPIRPCREGEAVGIAVGLMLGGASPVVVVQCTGFFEAGDAIRNAAFDLGLPLKLLVGVRGATKPGTTDNCPTFAEPVVRAWGLPVHRFTPPADETLALDWLADQPGPAVLLWDE